MSRVLCPTSLRNAAAHVTAGMRVQSVACGLALSSPFAMNIAVRCFTSSRTNGSRRTVFFPHPACYARAAGHTSTAASLSLSPLRTPVAGIFTNAKKSYARGTEEEIKVREAAALKESSEFLSRPVDEDGRNAPRAHDVEDRLPTKKQLNEELPTAAELEKALREGRMDAYATKPDNEED